MKWSIAAGCCAALSASASGAAIPVSVAGGDWSNIPRVHQAGKMRVSTRVIERIEQAAIGECALAGQSKRHVELTLPFMVRFSPAGAVEQIVVRRLDCPAIEHAVGGAVLTMANGGEYRPTGENVAGWYRGDISFTSR